MIYPSRPKFAAVLGCLVFGCAPAAIASAATTPSPAPAAALSPDAFRTPPHDAGVHAWWHWLDGAISREGITKDLETMKAQGVVQATILNVGLFNGRDFGVPRVPFASPAWFEMYRWALAEASRLGITLGVHNCDGWSSSGGPWITPEESMKQFTWSKSVVPGGRALTVTLPAPAAVAGFYRDVACVAYRTTAQPGAFRSAPVRLEWNDKEAPFATLVDGNPISHFSVKPGDHAVFSAPTPLSFSRLAVHLRRAFMWGNPAAVTARLAIETSADGHDYHPLAEVTTHGLNQTQLFDVPASSARFVRVTVHRLEAEDKWNPFELGELELLQPGESAAYAPSIPFIGEKTSAVKGADHAVSAVGTDAGALATGDVVVLTDRMSPDGTLHWDAPAGAWTILRFGYTSTGATNAPATAEGRGLECDKMDPAAVEHHFHAFSERLINEAGAEAGKTLRFILIDSWEAGFQNWTARFAAEFERRRGYSLIPWLPVLVGETVSSARDSEAVLFDFRRTIGDLIRENYYDRFASLLHERHIELHAEVIYGGGGYPPIDVLRATQNVDLPMLEFWTSAPKDSIVAYTPVDTPSMELPVCAAAGYGKPLVGSEAYTGYAHYSEAPADLKPFGDRGYAGGINRMILHSSVHQPTDAKPGMTLGQFASHFNRNNLYWPHARTWIEYQSRIQSLLGQGTPTYDVLYFLGDQLPQVYSPNAATAVPPGYAVTAVNADILASRVTVVNGRLRLNGTGDAAVLSLPPDPAMSLETLQLIATLVRDGAHVYGPKPVRPLSLADTRNAVAFNALATRVWGDVDGSAVLTHGYGKGDVTWGKPLAQVLAGLHAVPQFSAAPAAEKELLFTHRRVGDHDIFFVANQTDQAINRQCAFRVSGQSPEIWDPETGNIFRPAAFRVTGEELTVPVHFEPRQALLFVFRAGLPKRFITSIAQGDKALFPASGTEAPEVPWLRFDERGVSVNPTAAGSYQLTTNDGAVLKGAYVSRERIAVNEVRGTLQLQGPGVTNPAPFAIADLRSLTEYEAPEIRYFSGEATYRLRVNVPAAETLGADPVLLDIGRFESIAEITWNGEAVGQRWRPGVPIDVTGRVRRENDLTIKVVNVYRNRFIGDLAQFGEIRNLQTSSPIRDFLSASSPLKRSGLLGPITLIRERPQRVEGF